MGHTVHIFSDQWASSLKLNVQRFTTISMADGLSGAAVYFLLRHRALKGEQDKELFFQLTEAINTLLKNEYNSGMLLIELTDYLYILEAASALDPDFDAEELRRQLHGIILEGAVALLANGKADPYTGAYYQAWHLLQKNDLPAATPFVEYLVRETRLLADGSAYFDSRFVPGKLCLSITHGLAFYLVFLCSAYEKGVRENKILEIIRGYAQYLLAARLVPGTQPNFFPDYEGEQKATRWCLCYGDAGILYALLRAAMLLGDPVLYRQAEAMLEQTTDRRSEEQTGIRDASLLYGSAGIFIYYEKILRLTGNRRFKEAAAYWKGTVARQLHQEVEKNRSGALAGSTLKPLSLLEGVTGAALVNELAVDDYLEQLCPIFYLA